MRLHTPHALSAFGRGDVSAQLGGSPLTRAIQRGTIALTGGTSATATITSVDTANSRIRNLGQVYSNSADSCDQYFARLALTNVVTVTLTVNSSPAANTNTTSYEVSSHPSWLYRKIQRGTLTGQSTATIAAVVVDNTEVDLLGFTTSTVTTNATLQLESLVLTNITTITSGQGTNAATLGYQAAEYNL